MVYTPPPFIPAKYVFVDITATTQLATAIADLIIQNDPYDEYTCSSQVYAVQVRPGEYQRFLGLFFRDKTLPSAIMPESYMWRVSGNVADLESTINTLIAEKETEYSDTPVFPPNLRLSLNESGDILFEGYLHWQKDMAISLPGMTLLSGTQHINRAETVYTLATFAFDKTLWESCTFKFSGVATGCLRNENGEFLSALYVALVKIGSPDVILTTLSFENTDIDTGYPSEVDISNLLTAGADLYRLDVSFEDVGQDDDWGVVGNMYITVEPE